MQEEEGFVELSNVEMLRSLGVHGKAHIMDSEPATDRILDSLLCTLGKDRLLKIETDLLYVLKDDTPQRHEGTLSGKVVDVCADLNGTNSNSLMVVLSHDNNNFYVPLVDVRRCWF